MKPMNEQHLAIFRRHMVEVVDIHFDLSGEEIGKDRLDEPLRQALLKVPRHLFVPGRSPARLIRTRRSRSASTRRSPSPSSAR
jgi:hypothetical protein